VTVRAKVLAALAAIAVVFGGSLALVAWLTGGGPSTTAVAPPPAPDPAPPPAPDPAVTAHPMGMQAPGASVAAPAPVDVPPPPPPKDSWLAVKAVGRPGQLGPLGREISSALDDLQGRLATCTNVDVQARHGATPVTGLDGADEQSPPALMLELETLDGEVRIFDAPVENRGKADDGLFACAQKVLRGQVLPAPSARRGQRIRLMYPLPQ
jgi:hypothetical protein